MIRYWFEFGFEGYSNAPYGTRMGCGVTGINYDDVIQILKEKVFSGKDLPKIILVKENIDINELDNGHVLPNMLPPNRRGVWFPIGYQ
ncbi:hypothetical protein [Chitinophaga sp. LS1]|uniref:hypothetical protein n=1 Tax=Chitinophaga sp. LS1 TaxID=3051176 RepID=UPI002AAA8D6A|nr:hypothetical protein [Chitinophaga sp. LS1]WPV66103.1 hypothetical protein QQL36_30350 [Chitinophaga sp. LS1]